GVVGVEGMVKYNGKPVTGGKLSLHSKDGNYPINIQPDGTFNNSGLPKEFIGDVIVTVDTSELKDLVTGATDPTKMGKDTSKSGGKQVAASKVEGPELIMTKSAGPQPVYVEIPKKYADPKQSGLT